MIFKKDPLVNSIWKTAGLYSAGESLVFFIFTLVYSFSPLFFCLFLGVQAAFHLIMVWYLLSHRDFFFMVETKKKLDRVNTANKITLFRITMTPVLLFLILGSVQYRVLPVLLPLLILTFLSDLADGHISRINHERTFMGQILDSSGDYLLVGLIAIFYRVLKLLPGWLFLLILVRLIFNPLCMMILFWVHKKWEPHTTIGGKITIASMMGLFIPELLRLVFPGITLLCSYIEIFVAVILGLSLVDKGVYFVKKLAGPHRGV